MIALSIATATYALLVLFVLGACRLAGDADDLTARTIPVSSAPPVALRPEPAGACCVGRGGACQLIDAHRLHGRPSISGAQRDHG
jgi:hypothetical protein